MPLPYRPARAGTSRGWLDACAATSAEITDTYCAATDSKYLAVMYPHFIGVALSASVCDGVTFAFRHGDDLRLWAVFELPTVSLVFIFCPRSWGMRYLGPLLRRNWRILLFRSLPTFLLVVKALPLEPWPSLRPGCEEGQGPGTTRSGSEFPSCP